MDTSPVVSPPRIRIELPSANATVLDTGAGSCHVAVATVRRAGAVVALPAAEPVVADPAGVVDVVADDPPPQAATAVARAATGAARDRVRRRVRIGGP
ncbi:MAG TPA: hypothetical protein VFH45_02590 [Acidimicrobiales bacterium]|nr:hypothetical protein [Acidimicrobiales bacterium]